MAVETTGYGATEHVAVVMSSLAVHWSKAEIVEVILVLCHILIPN